MRRLSIRESQVIRLAAEGKSNAAIAVELGVKPSTVASQLRTAYQKFGVHSRAAAVAVAHQRGYIAIESVTS